MRTSRDIVQLILNFWHAFKSNIGLKCECGKRLGENERCEKCQAFNADRQGFGF